MGRTQAGFVAATRLSLLKCPQCAAGVNYSRHVVPLYNERINVEHVTNPLHAKVVDLLATTPRDILRWRVSANASAKVLPKTTLRTAMSRRWTHAFSQALQETGYTRQGRRSDSGKQGLVGTLELTVYGGHGLHTTMDDLTRECLAAIKAIEALQPTPPSHDQHRLSSQDARTQPRSAQHKSLRPDPFPPSSPFHQWGSSKKKLPVPSARTFEEDGEDIEIRQESYATLGA